MWDVQKVVKKGDYEYAVVPDHPKATKVGHYVLLHRIVMENYLGRLLDDDEVSHHIDENKKHNEIENLELCLSRIHARYHRKTGRTFIKLTCAFCSKEFLREKRNVHDTNKNHYCCRKHMNKKPL